MYVKPIKNGTKLTLFVSSAINLTVSHVNNKNITFVTLKGESYTWELTDFQHYIADGLVKVIK